VRKVLWSSFCFSCRLLVSISWLRLNVCLPSVSARDQSVSSSVLSLFQAEVSFQTFSSAPCYSRGHSMIFPVFSFSILGGYATNGKRPRCYGFVLSIMTFGSFSRLQFYHTHAALSVILTLITFFLLLICKLCFCLFCACVPFYFSICVPFYFFRGLSVTSERICYVILVNITDN